MNAVTLMIKSIFEQNEWKYTLDDNDQTSIDTFTSGFNLNNEKAHFQVRVYRESECYQILSSADSRVPLASIAGALMAANEFNSYSRLVCCCVDTATGDVIFFKGTVTAGLTFSETAFEQEMNVLMAVTDTETAQIIKKAVNYSPGNIPETPASEPQPRRGFFARLFQHQK